MHRLTAFFVAVLFLLPALAGELSQDHRVGVAVDVQGIVTVKPEMAARWSSVQPGLVLKPGDWVRAALRGPNAARLQLADMTLLTLGPGALVELTADGKARLTAGELEVVPPPDGEFLLAGPTDQSLKVTQRTFVRVKDGLQLLKAEPAWLKGFLGSLPEESMGSLLAKVDGREVPLTIGYHRLQVDIRDQIARTVIEESFVNHTDQQLEGVFYFPLPEDASISNFGMWIGGELVEADVVEKQRAREIYETILREKRDPGLLEWSGGNLFKARVFPIFAHSEKRVTITYTQVLPKVGNGFRYSYALQSEMLRQTPLRELAIDVKIHSAQKLSRVVCPSHAIRLDTGEHAAHIEFAAEEYRPDRDFELDIELAADTPPITVIPHRRGEDGYFMVLLSPPDGDSGPGRGLLPDGGPLRLVIAADSSGSMDADSRARQRAFIESLLFSLSPDDRFLLASCDTACRLLDDDFVAPTEDAAARALEFLDRTVPMGWTDLRVTFDTLLAQAGQGDHLVYVGDGLHTAHDADAAALSAFLDKRLAETGVVGHGVAVSSRFEAQVLRALAGKTGSWRRVRDLPDSRAAAGTLLEELLSASLQNIRLEFDGPQVAQLYPAEVPNLAAGRQLVLLGRYLPDSGWDNLMVRVVGLPGDNEGNSFIPRLWARRYLDALLEQGGAPGIKDEVIALSEEYRIMTPHTSFLVLESDADRERFGVKRRFRMRDGEKFFAKGRAEADYELLRRHMVKAADWRIELRRTMLWQIRDLGTAMRAAMPYGGELYLDGAMNGLGPVTTSSISAGATRMAYKSGRNRYDFDEDKNGFDVEESQAMDYRNSPESFPILPEAAAPPPVLVPAEEPAVAKPMADVFEGREMLARDEISGKRSARRQMEVSKSEAWHGAADLPASGASYWGDSLSGELAGGFGSLYSYDAGYGYGWDGDGRFGGGGGWGGLAAQSVEWGRAYGGGQYGEWIPYWITNIFPYLSPAVEVPEEAPKPEVKPWPEEARKLADAFSRISLLDGLDGALEVERTLESFSAARQEVTSRSEHRFLLSGDRWLQRSRDNADQAIVTWCDPAECGAYSATLQAGRFRKSNAYDLQLRPLYVGNYSLHRLDDSYPLESWSLAFEQGETGPVLLLRSLHTPDYGLRIHADAERKVVTLVESFDSTGTTSLARFDEYVEVAGALWPTRITTTDKDGKMTSRQVFSWRMLDSGARKKAWENARTGWNGALRFEEPLPSLVEAKGQAAGEEPSVASLVVMLSHFAQSQQWERVRGHLETLRKGHGKRYAFRWLEDEVLLQSGRSEELKERFLARARELAKSERDDPFCLSRRLLNNAPGFLYGEELLELLDLLEPLIAAGPLYTGALRQLQMNRVNYLQQVGRAEDSFRLLERLAKEYPHAYDIQYAYLYQLAYGKDRSLARETLDRMLGEGGPWEEWEESSLRTVYSQILYDQGKFPEFHDFVKEWMVKQPRQLTAYQQYLTSLVWVGRPEEADQTVREWLALGPQVKDWLSADALRFQAALYHALGQGYMIYTGTADPAIFPQLADLALALVGEQAAYHIVWQVVNHYGFRLSDAGRAFYPRLLEKLLESLGTLPAASLSTAVQWVLGADPDVRDRLDLDALVKALQARWRKETVTLEEDYSAAALLTLLQGLGRTEDALVFVAERWERADEKLRGPRAAAWFEQLMMSPWTEAREATAFLVLGRLGEGAVADAAHLQRVSALARVVPWALGGRSGAAMAAVDKPHEKSRTEMAELQKEATTASRTAVAERLLAQADKLQPELKPWLDVERATLLVRLERDLADVESLGRRALDPSGALPPGGKAEQEAIRSRWIDILEYLALWHPSGPESADGLVAWLEKQAAEKGDARHGWRLRVFRLLVALERDKPLEIHLRAWASEDRPDHLWRITLGYLLAERGEFAEAVALFEGVADGDELTPDEWQALSDWYLVLGRKEDRARAETQRLVALDEYSLSSWLQSRLYQLQARTEGVQVDDQVVAVARALLRKATYPGSYVWTVGELFQVSKDFRLYAALTEAVAGHTAQAIYPFIQSLFYQFETVLDEATVDSVVAAVQAARKTAESDLDRRGLDLLEVVARRRAAELANQPGPHTAAAVKALGRASKGSWLSGERQLMAQFLESMSAIPAGPLAEAQKALFKELLQGATRGSAERLSVAVSYARTLWAYGDRNGAIGGLESELDDYVGRHDGPTLDTTDAFYTLVSFLEGDGQYRRAEKRLRAALAEASGTQQEWQLQGQLFDLLTHALSAGGTVSHGTGKAIYPGARAEILAAIEKVPLHEYANIVRRYGYLLSAAHYAGVSEARKDLREGLVRLRKESPHLQPYDYHGIMSEAGGLAYSILGAQEAFLFLLDVLEAEPEWYHRTGQDGMNWHAYNIGQWRTEFKATAAQEARFLELLLRYLRRDLETLFDRGCSLPYQRCSGVFWEAKRAVFRKTALEVLEKNDGSPAILEHVAEYLASGLEDPAAAIDVLLGAWKKARLSDTGMRRLVQLLIEAKRFKECFAPAEALVKAHPLDWSVRAQLLQVISAVRGRKAALHFLKSSRKLLEDGKQWSEWVAAAMAYSAHQGELYEAADELFSEAIVAHRRNAYAQGVGDGTLADYYANQARARSKLGRTVDAVDAASSAIVAWGPDRDSRVYALETLREVLRESKDLAGYVKRFEAEVEKTGLENPLIRRLLAELLLERKVCKEALAHLDAALLAAPEDGDLLAARVRVLDCLGDKTGARAALASQLANAPYDLALYRELGQRFADAGEEGLAERAWTGVVEILPGEAESHRELAQVREEQGRWADAVAQWEHVVRLRGEDPDGYFRLAEACLRAGRFLRAGQVAAKLLKTDWHADFGDIESRARELLERLGRDERE